MLEPGDTDRPDTTNQNPTPATEGAAPRRRRGGGPRRKRVSELARELGLTSREVLTRLAELGVELRSASAAVDDAVADQLRAASEEPEPAPAAAAEPEPIAA